MKHPRPNKPHPDLPFLMVEAEEDAEVLTDEAWDAALGEPVDLNSLADPLEPATSAAGSDSRAASGPAKPVDLNDLAPAAATPAGATPAVRASDPGATKKARPESVRLKPADRPPFDAGEFRLVARLAVGGMSEVWLADALQGELAGRTVVVKRLLPSLRTDAGSVERFRAEALLGAALQHENFALTFGLHTRGLEMFLVQELLGGETLALLAAAARKQGERLPLAALLHAADGVLSALMFLHGDVGEGKVAAVRVVHGDVNPENVVCQFDGAVKLIDLGLAQTLRPDGTVVSPDGALRGTPAYMSPEQVKSRPLSPRSDLFSAGVMLWELFANRPLFAAESEFETLRRVREVAAPPLRAIWPQAPTALERLLVRALAKEPAQRFATAREFRESLRQLNQRLGGPGDGSAALAAEVLRLAPKGPKAD